MDNYSFNTAQNVDLISEKAGVGERFLAYLVDYILLAALAVLISYSYQWSNINNYIIWVIYGIIFFFYHFFTEVFMNGQSIGKKLVRIRVINQTGEPASLWQYFLRALLRPIDSILGLGLVVMIVSKKGQRIGDITAGTMVIRIQETVTLQQTVFTQIDPEYKPVFGKAKISRLQSTDIELIKTVTQTARRKMRYNNVGLLYSKVTEITGIETTMIPIEFLETVVKDFNYYQV
ncbi:MAG: RDD family protein [Bacteroidales bacterium]|nr:RDD family protein [Bacteroidales bacterium]